MMHLDARATTTSARTAEISRALTRVRRFLRIRVRTDFPWESVPMAQIEFLQRLAEEPGLRVSDLAQKHQMAVNTVSTLIQQLVTKGLVERTPVPNDRRASALSLTDEGEKILRSWTGMNESLLDRALSALDDDDRALIAAAAPALARLGDVLDRA